MAPYAEVAARSNFSLLDGASHPAELVATAAHLGHAGIGLCDTNTLAEAVRAHVAAKELGLRFAVGVRLVLQNGCEYLVWPISRTGYGRLTRLLSMGRMQAPKGECRISHQQMIEHAADWALAAVPPALLDDGFADRLRADVAELRNCLALPLLVAGSNLYRGLSPCARLSASPRACCGCSGKRCASRSIRS